MSPLTDAHNHAHELPGLGALPRCVTNGSSPADWDAVAAFAAAHPGRVTTSFGLHPWFIATAPAGWADDLCRRLDADPAAAVGECGLDRARRPPTLAEQETVFRRHLQIACEFGRAVSVHCVGAWGRMLEVLRTEPLPTRGVLLHSYAAAPELHAAFVALPEVCFSLCVCAPKPPDVELARLIPADRLLVESDATAHNGRLPADIERGLRTLAELRDEESDALAARIAANFARLFGGPTGEPIYR